MRQGRVSIVALRTPTSILLLSMLLVGILSPSGMCALMCAQHARAESPHHCGNPSDPTSGMVHHHSAMNHPHVEPVTLALTSQSCTSNCARAERLSLSRKVFSQAPVAETGVAVREATARFLATDEENAPSSDHSHAPPIPYAASLSVLRI
jgi:hypothetical protein